MHFTRLPFVCHEQNGKTQSHLTGVLSSRHQASTNHVVCDRELRAVAIALVVSNNGSLHLRQVPGGRWRNCAQQHHQQYVTNKPDPLQTSKVFWSNCFSSMGFYSRVHGQVRISNRAAFVWFHIVPQHTWQDWVVLENMPCNSEQEKEAEEIPNKVPITILSCLIMRKCSPKPLGLMKFK